MMEVVLKYQRERKARERAEKLGIKPGIGVITYSVTAVRTIRK